MNQELLALQAKVTGVIYNPFVNLKDHAKAVKALLSEKGEYPELITRLEEAIAKLDQYEDYTYGNMDRVKGFNKTKTHIIKIIKEVLDSQK